MATTTDGECGIVCVDDEERSLRYFRMLFPTETVWTFTNAADALTFLRENGPRVRVLVSDERMEGKSGHELLRECRAHAPFAGTILTTGYSDVEGMMSAVNEGGAMFILPKPWNIDQVRSSVAKAGEAYARARDSAALTLAHIRVGALWDQSASLVAAHCASCVENSGEVVATSIERWADDGLSWRHADLSVEAVAAAREQDLAGVGAVWVEVIGLLARMREWRDEAARGRDLSVREIIGETGFTCAPTPALDATLESPMATTMSEGLLALKFALGTYPVMVDAADDVLAVQMRAPGSLVSPGRAGVLLEAPFIKLFPLYLFSTRHGYALRVHADAHAIEVHLAWGRQTPLARMEGGVQAVMERAQERLKQDD